MNDAGVAPPGVMPIQQPTRHARSDVIQYFGSVAHVFSTIAGIDLGALALERQALLHREQDLAQAEEADHRDQEVEALQQRAAAEGHAQRAGHRVEADRGEREAQHHRRDRLHRRLAAHADEAAERQELDREVLGRPELAARTWRPAAPGT